MQVYGLGTSIIKASLAQAHDKGIPLSLQVLKANPALHLYERLDFVVNVEAETHYFMRSANDYVPSNFK